MRVLGLRSELSASHAVPHGPNGVSDLCVTNMRQYIVLLWQHQFPLMTIMTGCCNRAVSSVTVCTLYQPDSNSCKLQYAYTLSLETTRICSYWLPVKSEAATWYVG